MNLNQWYYYLLGGDYSTTRYSVYLAYRIINSQEDRIANNRSLVELRFYALRKSTSYYAYNGYDNTSYYEYDGGNRFNTTTRYDFRNATVNVGYFIDDGNSVLYKGSKHTFYVYHNADGSRNLPIYGYFYGGNTNFQYASGGTTIILPTIPRASQPSMSNFNIGSSVVINTNRVSTSFTHTIKVTFGTFQKTLATGVGDSYTWNTSNDDDDLYQEIPNATSGTGTITCETYSGATLIGTKTVGFTASVVNSNPTFPGFTFKDINNTTKLITGDDQKLIQGYSNIEITCSPATAKNYATMSVYKGQLGSKVVNSATTTIAFGTFTANDKLYVSAIDSRSLETKLNVTPTIIPYSAINLTEITTLRQNGVDPTVDMVARGVVSKILVSGVDQNAILVMKYRTKLTSSGTWGSYITFATGITIDSEGNFEVTRTLTGSFDTDSSYDVEFYIEDKLSNDNITSVIIKSTPLMSFRDGKIGINKIPVNGALDVAGDAYISGNANITGNINNITPTELGYLDNASSNIQDQLNNKITGWTDVTIGGTMTGGAITTQIGGANIDLRQYKLVNVRFRAIGNSAHSLPAVMRFNGSNNYLLFQYNNVVHYVTIASIANGSFNLAITPASGSNLIQLTSIAVATWVG